MLNFIIMSTLISLLYNYLFKRNIRANLNCGIFAWTGVSSDKFSPFLFNVLGIYNDSRGGDSSGVYFNRGSITGIRTLAKYENLVKDQKLHTTIKPGKWPIVIGHCRKASVGTIIESNVQPTLIRNIEKNDKLVYVQAHNGTITNHKELATKYKITVVADESDSNILAKLISQEGLKILGEYEGSAALVMHFIKEPNTLYVFHGQSKSYNVLTEERPLHYININGSGTYISSESAPLEFIANGEKAVPFKYNVVYKLTGDEVEEYQIVEREKAILKKYTPVNNTTAYNHYDYNDEWYNSYNNRNKMYELPASKKDLIHLGITKNICCSVIESTYTELHPDSKLRYNKGFFLVGTKHAHGEVLVDSWGFVRDIKIYPKTTISLYHLFFYYGILLLDKGAFDLVKKGEEGLGITEVKDFLVQSTFNKLSTILNTNSVFPFTRWTINPGSGYMEPTDIFPNDKDHEGGTFFTGCFTPLFADYELHFNNGDLLGFKKTNGIQTITEFLKDVPYMNEWGFGEEPKKPVSKITEQIEIVSCTQCVKLNIYKNGEKCKTCNLDFEDTPFEDVPVSYEENDQRITLCHTIAAQVNPIVGDLEDLITEVQTSGFQEVVSNELNILVEANNKLKEIIK